jgi:hypothetical protein
MPQLAPWNFIVSRGQTLRPGPPDMSLIRNFPNQNFTFALINVNSDNPLTGASFTSASWISKDGGAQSAAAGTFSELGGGEYNYSPTQAETNAACMSLFVAPTNAVPTNIMCLTGGLHKDVAGQHVTFGMFSTSGAADPSATVTVKTSKDGGPQSTGGGTVTNLGNGQYDYAPTPTELNGNNVSFLFSATGDVISNLSIFTVL